MVKPFSMAELQARIEAVLRRAARAARPEAMLQVADLRVDLNARQVWLSDGR
ncbi:hypothetical protein GA0074695_5229 [Micromonospora viridifaciens]|uniref:Uncharacterized protein n=1 Tax=Micromonospora viridifaciens TaxID=1881 RepID=A0A1C4Z874_MICVI|nr:hypothetical protein GA0074695_5229 [Micromonospora viridifaciens]